MVQVSRPIGAKGVVAGSQVGGACWCSFVTRLVILRFVMPERGQVSGLGTEAHVPLSGVLRRRSV